MFFVSQTLFHYFLKLSGFFLSKVIQSLMYGHHFRRYELITLYHILLGLFNERLLHSGYNNELAWKSNPHPRKIHYTRH